MKISQLPIVKEPLGSSNFKRVAVLQNVFNFFVNKEINGDYSYEFDMLIDDPKLMYVKYTNFIEVDGQLFTINNIDYKRETKGSKSVHVSGYHIFFRLNDFYREKDGVLDNYKPNVTLSEVVNELLENTPYSLVTTDITQRNDIMLERGGILRNIKKCINTFGGELILDNFKISIVKTFGEDKGILLRYKKNISSIKKSIQSIDVITRLYVYGKDGLTIESVNGGKKYLDSQYINEYPFIRNNEITYNNITNPNLLLEKGNEYLKEYEKPRIIYRVNVVDLTKLDPSNTEKFSLGDTVHVVDKELNIKTKSRILKYKEYMIPSESPRSVVTVNDKPVTMTDFYVKYNKTSNIVEKVFNQQTKDLDTNYLDGAINTLKNNLLASGTYNTAEVLEDKGYLLENTNTSSTDYGAMYIGPGIFAIASDKVGGKWNWRTFGTGKGFVADEIITGTLNAGLVNVINLDADNINTGTLNAIDIYGSTITGSVLTANNSTSNTKVEINPSDSSVFSIKYFDEPVFRIQGKDMYIGSEINFDNTNVFNEIDISTASNQAYIRNNNNYLTIFANDHNLEFGSVINDNITLRTNNDDFNIYTGEGMMNLNNREVATMNKVVKDYKQDGIMLKQDGGYLQYSTNGEDWKKIVVTD
ncbi:phage tail protein [Vallitalea guaymasensis]|uniref:phage tail protein n=1 Tax=Vallitalea guaymasensis TaxID=1185412 RepID=UPI000DE260E6|nr:phage tail protein [Vallitalea guaymasensis]